MSSRKNTHNAFSNSSIIFFAVFAWFILNTATAHAATLGISPANDTVSVGKTITVRVLVNSQGQSINAVSGGVTFSNDLLTLVGISKSGSVVSLWAQAPSYSNISGMASFQGVILNGFTGTGTVLTLTFRAKAVGVGTIGLSSSGSSVLLNDGQGTNVLSGTASDIVTVIKGQVTVPSQPSVPVVATPVLSTAPAPAPTVPIITDYQSPLLSNNFIVVKGTADPNSTLTVTLSSTTATVVQTLVTVAPNGTFTYVSDNKVSEGTYTVAIATNNGQQSQPVTIIVKNPLSFVLKSWIDTIVSMKIALWWVILLLLVCGYLWHRNRVLRRHIKDALDRIHSLEQK